MDRMAGWCRGSLALAASAVFAGSAWQSSRFVYRSESGALQASTAAPPAAAIALVLLLPGLVALWRRHAAWAVGLLVASLAASLLAVALGAFH